MSKLKRYLAMLLATISLCTCVPLQANANEQNGGGGAGGGTVLEGATFSSGYGGYRFYIIDREGNLISNKVDIVRTYKTPAFPIYNTKFEPLSSGFTEQATIYKLSDLSYLFNGEMPKAMYKKVSTGPFYGNGEAFRDWMTAGQGSKNAFDELGGGGGGGNISYTPNGDGGISEDEELQQVSKFEDAANSLYVLADAELKLILAGQSNYSRAGALLAIRQTLEKRIYDLGEVLDDPYSMKALDEISIEITEKLERELPQDGWKDPNAKSEDSLSAAGFLESLFDVAYAAEYNANVINVLNAQFNGSPIFHYTNGVTLSKDKDGKDNIAQTLIDNNYVLCVEATFQWVPRNNRKNWPSGKYFYGTVTNYAQAMLDKNITGNWDPGKNGGNAYGTQINQTAATSLRLMEDLQLEGAGASKSVKAVEQLNNAASYETLASTTHGYDMHYYVGKGPGLPRIPTRDPEEVPKEHLAPDPSPENIPLVPGEPKTPGDPIRPDNPRPTPPGYLNTTRIVNIIKVYDIEYLDGSIDHVTTTYRRDCPVIVDIQHEDDYKCIGYFTSTKYYGDTLPESPDVLWDEFTTLMPATEGEGDYSRQEIPWDEVKDKPDGELEKEVKLGLACDHYDKETQEPKDGVHYNDNTVYVHLLKKEKVPETSTFDEPDNPPSGKPPCVPPHPSDDPFQPKPSDPETDHVDEGNRFAHYRIVKVYETWEEQEDSSIEIIPDGVHTTDPTNPIVYIQDEKQSDDPYDGSYHLRDWEYGDEYKPETFGDGKWENVISAVSAKESGTTVAKVDLIDKDDPEKTVTLYVHLVKMKRPKPLVSAPIIIQESQISKTIRSNDSAIGGRFGNYKFAQTVNFPYTHTTHFYHGCCQKRYGTDSEGNTYVIHDCGKCHGHTCTMHMPGPNTDPDVNFIYDETSPQDQLEIKLGVNSQTDSKVYGKGGASGTSKAEAIQYPEKIKSLDAEPNIYRYTSNGKDKNGAEYVTILWRGTSKDNYKDVPTLAKYKESDVKLTFGSADNYNVPKDVLASGGTTPDRKSQKKRASDSYVGLLEFSFGLRGDSDITGNSACDDIQGEYDTKCVHKDFRDYYPIEGTKFIWDDFQAGVAIRFYAGKSKSLQAQPFGGQSSTPILEKKTGNHKELNVIQCKQIIKFYPYIRMTYMVNSLDDATKEAQNTDTNGYKQDVRKDTYVLSEWESQVLPSDAVRVEWKKGGQDENLLLTSQQWSVHQKAVNGGQDWNGKNQVLPGGAIYQLSTPKDGWVTVGLTTYQTVIDQKARNEYLTASNTLSGDEYTESIKSMVQSMQELDYDTYAKGQTGGATVTKLCDKKVPGSGINSRLSGDAKDIDDATSFITNFVSALTRNQGIDYTSEWASGQKDGKWYNEAFDGAYLVRQSATFNIGFAFSSTRTSALDPALCPQNKGQSDLYTKAFLSQFCTDSQSDAAVAQGKKQNYLGTFKDTDITLPDMESLYISKKFYIPNANVQDLN